MGSTVFLSASLVVALLMLHLAALGGAQTWGAHEAHVPFPPARPSLRNLDALCHQGNGRPWYPDSFFPRSGSSHERRCGNAVNRMEVWFSGCCSRDVAKGDGPVLCCAQQAWRYALSLFCKEEYSTKTLPHECCEERGDARWSCFERKAINPSYLPTQGYTAPHRPAEPGFTWDPHTC